MGGGGKCLVSEASKLDNSVINILKCLQKRKREVFEKAFL